MQKLEDQKHKDGCNHLTSIRMAAIKQTKKTQKISVGKNVQNTETLVHFWRESKMLLLLWESDSPKIKNRVTVWPSSSSEYAVSLSVCRGLVPGPAADTEILGYSSLSVSMVLHLRIQPIADSVEL